MQVTCPACLGARDGPHSSMCKKCCAHCAERMGGAEGTIWCAECLAWWRDLYAKESHAG
jgi:hypothetical protein